MTETSSLTFSAGRVEMNIQAGSRGRFGGDVLELAGLASAKQIFLPPGLAVYAPQSPYCPSRVGCAPPGAGGAAGAAAGGGFGAAGGAAALRGVGGAGFAARACRGADAAPAEMTLPATIARQDTAERDPPRR